MQLMSDLAHLPLGNLHSGKRSYDIWQLRVVAINYYAKQLPYRGGSFSGLPIGMIAARVVVASDETAIAALRKSKIYNVSTEAKR